MKTNGTLLKPVFILLLSLSTVISFAQPGRPDYVFKNSSLVSGTANDVGAVYRFPSVKTGVDALVAITYISTDVKIVDFDDNKNGGFDDAFQPRIQAKGKTNGYAEFKISFVVGGTSIPALMGLVNPTSIDVDGNRSATDSMLEYDEYMTPGAYLLDYDMVATDLQFKFKLGSVMGKNKRGLEKDLIDTLAKEAMFGIVYPAITNFTVRIGLDNQLNGSTTRQRSVYFMRFAFSNSYLPINNLTSFRGNRNSSGDVNLYWNMNAGHDFATAMIEKSADGKNFTTIGQQSMIAKTNASYTDQAKGAAAYYRLKMIDKNGKENYSSVLFIRNGSANKMAVYPTLVNDQANITYSSESAGNITMSVFDQAGRMMMKKDYNIQSGTNSIAVSGLSQFAAGQYVVMISSKDGASQSQRIQVIK